MPDRLIEFTVTVELDMADGCHSGTWWEARAYIGKGVKIIREDDTPGKALSKLARAIDNYPENFLGVDDA